MTRYVIQACNLNGSIEYTVYANSAEQMHREVMDALNDGFIVQIGKLAG